MDWLDGLFSVYLVVGICVCARINSIDEREMSEIKRREKRNQYKIKGEKFWQKESQTSRSFFYFHYIDRSLNKVCEDFSLSFFFHFWIFLCVGFATCNTLSQYVMFKLNEYIFSWFEKKKISTNISYLYIYLRRVSFFLIDQICPFFFFWLWSSHCSILLYIFWGGSSCSLMSG